MAEQEIENRALESAYRNKRLTPTQTSNNHVKFRLRRTVERVLGGLKHCHGMGQARYRSKAKNRLCVTVQCVVYNIKRGVNVQKERYGMQERYA